MTELFILFISEREKVKVIFYRRSFFYLSATKIPGSHQHKTTVATAAAGHITTHDAYNTEEDVTSICVVSVIQTYIWQILRPR